MGSVVAVSGWSVPSLIPLAVFGAVYGAGVVRLRRRVAGRGALPGGRIVAFAAGLLLTGVALASPLEGEAVRRLSWHMVQHIVLVVGAAPSLAAGLPEIAVPAAFDRDAARRMSARIRSASTPLRGSPAVPRLLIAATSAHVVVVLVWHAPVLYEAALSAGSVHALEHLLFLGTAYLVWSLILRRDLRSRLGRGTAVLCLAGMIVAGGALGALLTFAPEPIYPTYAAGTGGTVDPLTDQQLAGLIMWVPPGIAYGGAAVVLFLGWLRTMDRWMHRTEVDATPSRGSR